MLHLTLNETFAAGTEKFNAVLAGSMSEPTGYEAPQPGAPQLPLEERRRCAAKRATINWDRPDWGGHVHEASNGSWVPDRHVD